jgi:hypothetical protein
LPPKRLCCVLMATRCCCSRTSWLALLCARSLTSLASRKGQQGQQAPRAPSSAHDLRYDPVTGIRSGPLRQLVNVLPVGSAQAPVLARAVTHSRRTPGHPDLPRGRPFRSPQSLPYPFRLCQGEIGRSFLSVRDAGKLAERHALRGRRESYYVSNNVSS